MSEVRFAIRRLIKRPGASLASIVTLAAAIGAATATWSLLSAVLIHPLPIRSPQQLLVVGFRSSGPNARLAAEHTYDVFARVRDARVLAQLSASGTRDLLAGAAAPGQPARVSFVSANYFDVLGVSPARGRGFGPDDDRRGAPLVAILSDRYWRREFGADPSALSRAVIVAGTPVAIVGVATPQFRGLTLTQAPDIYMPLHTAEDVGDVFMSYLDQMRPQTSPIAWLTLAGRLGPGATPASAGAAILEAMSSARRPGAVLPEAMLTNADIAAIPEAARGDMRRFSRLLAITVGLLLLIGALTVGMLVLVRTEARREEFAMCLALGASRGSLARGVALEGALLSVAGALLALPVALIVFGGVRAFQLPGAISVDFLDLHVDGRALAAAILGAVGTSMVIAVIAGVFSVTANLADALRVRSGVTPRLTRRRTRSSLVIAQVAIAVVLLAGAGLFARSLSRALSLNPGFDTSRLGTTDISLGAYGYTPARATDFFQTLLTQLSANALIRSMATTASQGAMSGGGYLVIDGERRQVPSTVTYRAVDDRYFSTMGLRVTSGRDFTGDDGAAAPKVIIVSESFGRLLARGQSPLGHRLQEAHSRIGQPPDVDEVIGVVPDVITNVNVLEPLVIYYSIAQEPSPLRRTLVVRTRASAAATATELTATVKQIDANVLPSPFVTMDDQIGKQMAPQRFGRAVMMSLGVIAALLTLLGTYVLAESMASIRRRELGIRAALGATRRQLGGIVFGEVLWLVGVGLALGLLAVRLSGGAIKALLYHVEPFDPVTMASVAAVMLLLALVVGLRPAISAARVDLSAILRDE